MSLQVLLLACLIYQGQVQGQSASGGEECGGMLTAQRGVLQTPNFPRKFPVPLRCRWVIDSSQLIGQHLSSAIVVYFTQLFVSSGLVFTEFDYYEHDSTFQLGGREIHRVTEENVTRLNRVETRRPYLVVDFVFDHLEGNHLRVLDDLLDVFGFNISYEIGRSARTSCSVANCSMSGHCYVSKEFREFSCTCFPGFSGADCSMGPLCQPTSNVCEYGAVCRQVGSTASLCQCPAGLTGVRCEVKLSDQECRDEDNCTVQCPEDSSGDPCACGHRGSQISNGLARYEGTLRLTNVSAVRLCLESSICSLKPVLTSQISKYLKGSNLTVMDNLRVLDVGFSGEVRFHFWGEKSDGSRVRESLNRLVQKGKLGNISLVATHLAIAQEPTLHLQSLRLNQPKPQVREGEGFVLSCIAQGSSHLAFKWFKDGVFINVTRSKRNIWTRLLPLDSTEHYTALLGVENAHPLDHGTYTCQVTDWGYQQCRSIRLRVLQAPQVKVDPMSVTLEKGENVIVKCTSPNEMQFDSKFGYSWTKNNALFKMTPEEEFWEDLYPGGSILRISNVQKSATYSCHVHGVVRTVSRHMRLEVLNQSVVPWCPADESGVGGIRWDRTGPGVVAKVECPGHYSGVATRLCLLVEGQQVLWQIPDFSECVSDKISTVLNNFQKVTLGYGDSTAMEAVFGVLTSLRDRGVIYPGEGEPAISLLTKVTSYLEETGGWEEIANSTQYFYSAVNTLLQHRHFVVNHQKVEELQKVVNTWAGLWGGHTGSTGGSGSAHLAFDNLVVDLFRYEELPFRRAVTLHIPRPTLSYPQWFTTHATVSLENINVFQNTSSCVAVIVYNKLAEFLPQRYSLVLESGQEVQYEVVSEVISIVARGQLKTSTSVELQRTDRPGWDLRCALSTTPSSQWNVTACKATPVTSVRVLCQCPSPGTVAAVLVKIISVRELQARRMTPRIVLVGCAFCLVQVLLTTALLSMRWWCHRTCLTFLKLQSCVTILSAMVMFSYSLSRNLPKVAFPSICTSLQAVILISLSSHLSKILLVYTEIIYPPNVKNLKQTIISVMSGVPLIVVLCNHLAQESLDELVVSWWLRVRTMVFYTCVSCVVVLALLFLFLYCHVSKRLRILKSLKNMETKKSISRRLGLLNRAAVVFSGTVIMAASSVFYVNYPSVRSQYLFSLSSALLGFLVLVCYVLHCESPQNLQVLKTLKIQKDENPAFVSESDISPLSIFTKQEAEVECEGAPPKQHVLQNGKAEPVRESPSGGTGGRESECWGKSMNSLSDIVTVSEKVSREVDMELYSSSPPRRKVSRDSPERLEPGTTRVCVITSVLVDTASVVVCSVDVEPCSVLNKCIVSSGETTSSVLPVKPLEDNKSANETEKPPLTDAEEEIPEGDMMDRICHDLDYLLGGVNPSPEIPNILVQNTSL